MTITGAAKYLRTEDSVKLVGECGTGKTLMSIGIAHAHADGKPYSTLVMCPPHLVLKWAREVLVTVPLARTFVVYDLRNGGDPSKPHGILEVKLRNGQPRRRSPHRPEDSRRCLRARRRRSSSSGTCRREAETLPASWPAGRCSWLPWCRPCPRRESS